MSGVGQDPPVCPGDTVTPCAVMEAIRHLFACPALPGSHMWVRSLLGLAADISGVPGAVLFVRNGPTLAVAGANSQELHARCAALDPVVVEELAAGPAQRTPDLGVVLPVPLRRGRDILGCLMLFGPDEAGTVGQPGTAVEMLCGAAALQLDHARTVEVLGRDAAQLREALESRVLVEQAKGFLAARDGLDVDTAFEFLRRRARGERRPVAEVAAEVLARR